MKASSPTASKHSSGWHRRSRTRRRWGKILGLVLLVVVVALLYKYAKDVDWNAVHKAVLEIPRAAIAGAVGATALGYLAYAGMDALGRRYTGNRIAYWKVIGVAMISYAVNLNLGMLLGGVGVRMRLYMRLGCRKSLPARVAIFSGVSNWIGYGWVAGALFLSGLVPLPPSVAAGADALRITGFVLLVSSLIYVLACWRYPKRTWVVRGWRIVLPTLRMAIAQSVISICSWCAMALAIYLLLQGRIPYPAVLGVLLYSAVAALIARMPGGLGTTEALFVAALSQQISSAEVLGAILAYRAIFFLCPFVAALLAYGSLEGYWTFRRRQSASPARPPLTPTKT